MLCFVDSQFRFALSSFHRPEAAQADGVERIGTVLAVDELELQVVYRGTQRMERSAYTTALNVVEIETMTASQINSGVSSGHSCLP